MTVSVRASRTKIDGCCRADGEWPVHSRHHWLVCEGDTIVTVNDNFAALIGCSADSVVGAKLEQYFSGTDISRTFFNKKLDQEIEAALAMGRRLAVLCLDLDRFKEVNDLCGDAAGDRALQSFAKRVGGMLDENQMLARLGGDEFAIIAPGLSLPTGAGRIAETILEALQSVGANMEIDTPIAVSIGIAICPEDATDRHALLSQADIALYRAKNEGRGTYRYFDGSMGAAIRDRRLLEHDLRNAISVEG
jgi:diguanylate cyclase